MENQHLTLKIKGKKLKKKKKSLLQRSWSILSKCQISLTLCFIKACFQASLSISSSFSFSLFVPVNLLAALLNYWTNVTSYPLLSYFLTALTDAIIKTLSGKSWTKYILCLSCFSFFFKKISHWRSGGESACRCRGHGFEPWSGKIPHAA